MNDKNAFINDFCHNWEILTLLYVVVHAMFYFNT